MAVAPPTARPRELTTVQALAPPSPWPRRILWIAIGVAVYGGAVLLAAAAFVVFAYSRSSVSQVEKLSLKRRSANCEISLCKAAPAAAHSSKESAYVDRAEFHMLPAGSDSTLGSLPDCMSFISSSCSIRHTP